MINSSMTAFSMKLIPLCFALLRTLQHNSREAESHEQSRCGGVSFHLRAIYQQESSNPTVICGSNKAGGSSEGMEGRGEKAWKPDWLCLQDTVANMEAKESCRSLLNPLGGPLELYLLPVWRLPQLHEEPTWDDHGICMYSTPLSRYTVPLPSPHISPRSLLDRKLSARPLLLYPQLRMGPLLSPIHTSLVAAKKESTPLPIIATASSRCSPPLRTVCSLYAPEEEFKTQPRSQAERI